MISPPKPPLLENMRPFSTTRAKRSSKTSNKDEYREFCCEEISLPLTIQDWWLDATVGPHGWDVALVKKGSLIVASMPYVVRARLGMKVLTQPLLTPALGPWLRETTCTPAKKASNDCELMQALIDQLPRFDHFSQTWHHGLKNWLPFFWNGFQQTTYYTRILPDLSDTEKLWRELDGKVRRQISKVQEAQHLRICDDLPLEVLIELSYKTYRRQGLRPPFSDKLIHRLDAACTERNCRKLIAVVDDAGKPISCEYFVWDQNSAYGLLAGTDPAHRQSGVGAFCLWSTILQAASVTRQYNFCGSMIKPIETFIRGFGGEQIPYFFITKTPSQILKIRKSLLALTNKGINFLFGLGVCLLCHYDMLHM